MAIEAVFRALSDPTRRELLALLRSGDLTAGQLAERFPLARSTLSEHCAVLKTAGLVVTERQGNVIVYSLNVSAVEEALGAVLGLLRVGAEQPTEIRKDQTIVRLTWRTEWPHRQARGARCLMGVPPQCVAR